MMACGGLSAASETCRTSLPRWTISRNNDIFSPQYPAGEGMLFPASSPSLPGIAKDALIRPMPGNSAFPILLAGSYKFTLL